jgi:hypothetical protein
MSCAQVLWTTVPHLRQWCATQPLQAETVFGCIRQLHIVQLVVGFGPSGMVPRFRIDLKEIAGKPLAVPHN